jgi:colanic acid/amylovoran biosynthesis glycosyltransferase
MKIVFCAYDGKNVINGVNVWLLNLLPALKKRGIEVTVIAITWAPEDDCTLIPLLKKNGIDCTIVNPRKRYIENEVKWILKYVKRQMPDVFVANTMLPAFYASSYLDKAGIPTVCVIHSDNEWNEAVGTEAGSLNGIFKFKAIVTVSDYLFFKFNSYRNNVLLKKIPCGVSIIAARTNFATAPFKIAYVGRLAKHEKNIDYIITAFCETVRSLPNVQAYVYGSGPDYDLVTRILKSYDISKNVFLKGNIAHEEIYPELINMHVIALMSELEGLPVSLMEAMSLGVVPISTKIPSGVPELITDNETGLFIDSPKDFSDKVKWLIENPADWERLSINAKKHITQNYNADKSTDSWVSLFNEIASVKKRQLQVPFRIKLPKLAFSTNENREPNMFVKLKRKFKRGFFS